MPRRLRLDARAHERVRGRLLLRRAPRAPREETQPVITWPEGNGRLVPHLYECPRAKRSLGWPRPTSRRRAGGRAGSRSRCHRRRRQPAGYRADHVIFAAPRFVAKRVIRPWRDAPPAFLADFEYGAWMVANLTLRDRPKSRGFAFRLGQRVLRQPVARYVVATHQRAMTRARPSSRTTTRSATTTRARRGRASSTRAGPTGRSVALHHLSARSPRAPRRS